MAGRVLTEEDFPKGGGGDAPKDTPPENPPVDEGTPGKDEGGPVDDNPPVDKGGEESPPKPSDESKKFKYKSQEEAETAYKEAERKMHEATTAKAALEKKLAQFEKPPEKQASPTDPIADITDEALKEIYALKADSPTKDRDAAIIWAKAQRKISRMEINDASKETKSEHDIVVKTYERATKEGIKTDAELKILGYEYSKADSNLSTDERIDAAINSTKGILSQIREGFEAKAERDKKEKDDLKVLGRGSSRPKVDVDKKDSKPMTMSEQLAQINEGRKVKKESLRY
jgi:hypothetical protein